MQQPINKLSGKQILSGHTLEWRVNTSALLKEMVEGNPSGAILFQPVNIFKQLLALMAQRATEINDPVLNGLMCRLALYAEADPYDKNYNREALEEALSNPVFQKWMAKKYAPVSWYCQDATTNPVPSMDRVLAAKNVSMKDFIRIGAIATLALCVVGFVYGILLNIIVYAQFP